MLTAMVAVRLTDNKECVLKNIAIWTNRLLWTVIVSALVLIACYVSIGRYYATYIEGYQSEIVSYLQDYTELPLQVEQLSARWLALSPVFSLRNVSLPSRVDGEDVLRIGHVRLQLDLFNSLLNRSLQLRHLSIDGLQGTVEEVAPGVWQLRDYSAGAKQNPAGDFDKIIDILLSLDAVELVAATLKLHYFEGLDYALLNVDELSLRHSEGFRRATVKARFDRSNKPLLAIVESVGDPREVATFAASAYLKLDDVDFASQLPAIKPLGLDLRYAQLSSEIWLDWQPGGEAVLQGKVSSPLVDLAAISVVSPLPLEDFEVHFRLEKQPQDHWALWMPKLRARWQGAEIGFDRLLLTANSQHVTVALPALELRANLSILSEVALFDPRLNSLLRTLAPAGWLDNVQLHLPRSVLDDDESGTAPLDSLLLRSNLRQVSASPWKGAPGVAGLSGFIEVGRSNGLMDIDSAAFSLSFPKLYDQPLAFTSARGQLRWSLGADNVLVNSGPVYLTTEHGPATAQLALDLPKVKSAAVDPLMSLAVGLQETDTGFRDKFIPTILSPGLRQWLDSSIRGGQVRSGGLLYRGSLNRDDKADQTVQLFFDVVGSDLNYHPDWPPLTDVNGLVVVDDGRTVVSTSAAKLYDMVVEPTEIEVNVLAQGGLWLTIKGAINGAASSALKVVNESALRAIVGPVFERWQLTGTAKAVIDLGIPLAQPSLEPVVSVDLELFDTLLELPDYRLRFVDVNGPLHYRSARGIWTDAISAQFFDQPLRASVSQDSDKVLQVDASGLIDMADIERWSGQPAMGFFSGAGLFDAQVLVIPGGDSTLTLSSELRGVAVDLPAPYAKTASQELPFDLKLPLASSTRLSMEVAPWGQMQLDLQQGVAVSGLLQFGSTESVLNSDHEAGFFSVGGEMANAELQQWQRVLQQYTSAAKGLDADTTSTTGTVKELADTLPTAVDLQPLPSLAVRIEQLTINQLDIYGQLFGPTVLSAQHRNQADNSQGFNLYSAGDGWYINAENALLSGALLIPDNSANAGGVDLPLQIRLSRFSLPSETANAVAAVSPDPSKLKGFTADIQVDQLVQGREILGNLAFEVRPIDNGLRFSKLRGTIREIEMAAGTDNQLSWWRDEQGNHSALSSTFSIADVGDVLERWKYQRIIESESGKFVVDLAWPGSPDQWQLRDTQGTVDLGLREGRFLEGSDAANGTLKVVSIVNLAGVLSLQSNFSDFFKSGISFDRVDGQITLAEQRLSISDDINITSSSSEFSLRGVTDMATQLLDMELIVTLPVAGNLPWIAAFTAGLPVAAGVFVVSKIFQRQVKKFSSGVYAIVGDWNNPKMTLNKVFGNVGGVENGRQLGTNSLPAANDSIIAGDGTEQTLGSTQTKVKLAAEDLPAAAGLDTADSAGTVDVLVPAELTP